MEPGAVAMPNTLINQINIMNHTRMRQPVRPIARFTGGDAQLSPKAFAE
jgi:hypothetical protein